MAETDKIIFPCKDSFQFPIGYILMSASKINPATFLNYGKWVLLGSGRTILGASDTDNGKETGGSFSKKLVAANIPAHTHSLPSHTHQVPAHNHTASSDKKSHSHEIGIGAGGAHSHSIGNNGSHNHSIRMNTLRVEVGHKHERGTWTQTSSYVSEGANFNNDNNSFFGDNKFVINSAGTHSHTLTSAGSHGHTSSCTAWEHNHTITVANKDAFNTATGGSGNSGSVGSGTAFDITPSYIKLFIWERIE